jgi:hypothetical protein
MGNLKELLTTELSSGKRRASFPSPAACCPKGPDSRRRDTVPEAPRARAGQALALENRPSHRAPVKPGGCLTLIEGPIVAGSALSLPPTSHVPATSALVPSTPRRRRSGAKGLTQTRPPLARGARRRTLGCARAARAPDATQRDRLQHRTTVCNSMRRVATACSRRSLLQPSAAG